MNITSLGITDFHLKVDVFVDAWLVVNFVLGSGFQRGDKLLLLGLAAIGVLTGKNHQLELLAFATHH